MLTKKDYKIISDVISDLEFFTDIDIGNKHLIIKEDLITLLCIEFKKNNPNFNEYEFKKACKTNEV